MLNEYKDRIYVEIIETRETLESLIELPLKNITEQIVSLVTGTLEIGIPFLETCVEGYHECGGKDKSLIEVSQILTAKLNLLIETNDIPQKLSIAKDMLVVANSVNLNNLKQEAQAA